MASSSDWAGFSAVRHSEQSERDQTGHVASTTGLHTSSAEEGGPRGTQAQRCGWTHCWDGAWTADKGCQEDAGGKTWVDPLLTALWLNNQLETCCFFHRSRHYCQLQQGQEDPANAAQRRMRTTTATARAEQLPPPMIATTPPSTV